MDQVLHKDLTLQPGPFQILLTTHTAIKVAEKDSWIHWTHIKPAVMDLSPASTTTPAVPPVRLRKDPETDQRTLAAFFNIPEDGEGEDIGNYTA